jgi:L-fuconolactonase
MLGDGVQSVLEAHMVAGGGRFRGIRNQAASDESLHWEKQRPKGMLLDPTLRAGFGRLAPMGLIYDAWQFFTQLDDVVDLARSFPNTTIVLNHLGGILGVGAHEGRLSGEFAYWKAQMRKLAPHSNVFVKVGGLGMPKVGFPAALRPKPPSSDELAVLWRPYVETSIELFGAARCMFESDFPPDKQTCSYRLLWNAFKRLSHSLSADEKADLFHDTADRVYRLTASAGPVLHAAEKVSPNVAEEFVNDK